MNSILRLTTCALVASALCLSTTEAWAAGQEAEFAVIDIRVSVDDATTLAGALTLPPGQASAAMIMISGTGHHTRDSVISGFPIFRAMAEELAARGIATLRMDESGVGESTGPRTAHFRQRVSHMSASLDALRSRPELADVPFGVLGHSEGALIAPLIHAEYGDDIDFLVLLAAPGVRGLNVWVDQQTSQSLSRFPDITEADLPAMRAAFTAIAEASVAADPQAVRAATLQLAAVGKIPVEAIEAGSLDPFIERMASDEMRHFLDHDPVFAFSQVNAPILTVWGGADLQTAPGLNAPPLMAARNPQGRLTAVILPSENHFFLHGEGLAPGEHRAGEMRLSQEIVSVISRWVEDIP